VDVLEIYRKLTSERTHSLVQVVHGWCCCSAGAGPNMQALVPIYPHQSSQSAATGSFSPLTSKLQPQRMCNFLPEALISHGYAE